ncbi:ACT domain-containing protein [Candidatus Dependentiae bacterium]|nr:ACT domain-containing protein [Candidatus Dependentiae bacterium]
MLLKQISIFLENKPGKLAEVTKILHDNKVNIRALSMADTTDFGILRIIVPEVEKIYKLLKDNHLTVKITEVIGVKVKDCPGGLHEIINYFAQDNINVEYMYAFVNKSGNDAIIIFKVKNIQQAINILVNNSIELFKYEDILTI